jgi:hypothetical protein
MDGTFHITPAAAPKPTPDRTPRNILTRPIELPAMRNIKDGNPCPYGDPYCPCQDGDPCNHEEQA